MIRRSWAISLVVANFEVPNTLSDVILLLISSIIDQTEIPVSAVLHPPLPPTNFYFMSIMRILDVKRGPFHEHSSQLYSIAKSVPNWGKVNTGLFKMYEVPFSLLPPSTPGLTFSGRLKYWESVWWSNTYRWVGSWSGMAPRYRRCLFLL